MRSRLTHLEEGQQLVYGGDQVVLVSAELARSFMPGDRLVIVQDTGDPLRIPQGEHELVSRAVGEAVEAFVALADCSDDQITTFFEQFARTVDEDAVFAEVLEANRMDVDAALAKGRSTTRLTLSPEMRRDMAAGLRSWAASPIRRQQLVSTIDHERWSVSAWRARSAWSASSSRAVRTCSPTPQACCAPGNTAVFRIGSDALGTARAIMRSMRSAGTRRRRAARRRSAAGRVGRASRRLGAVRRPAAGAGRGSRFRCRRWPSSVRWPASTACRSACTGPGGAWIVVSEHADADVLAQTIEHSLDRKVCNTMNVCCVPRATADEGLRRDQRTRHIVRQRKRGAEAVVHRLSDGDHDRLGEEWEWENVRSTGWSRSITLHRRSTCSIASARASPRR